MGFRRSRPTLLILVCALYFASLVPRGAWSVSTFRGAWRYGRGRATPDEVEHAIQAIEPTTFPTAAPKFNQSTSPQSPRSAKDISPTDAGESIDNTMGKVADVLDPIPSGMPELWEGQSCRESCLGCLVSAAEYGESDTCTCKSHCLKGPMDDICDEGAPGWSNELESKTDGHFVAKCGVGELDCNSCTMEASRNDIAACRGDLLCLHEVHDRLLAMEQVRFCTQEQLSTCESFNGGSGPKDNGWQCFKTYSSCLASKQEAAWVPPSRKFGHCTWCDIAGAPQPGSEKKR